ncbi:ABC transporter permease, partial [Halorubrum sp. SD612]|uniref:ABC transporter permease n=1 Tax=Halorubrum sp. SD612 TaxID=1855863 RepID=UPI000A2E430F
MATETASPVSEGDALAGVGLGDWRRLLRGAAGVVGFLVVWHAVSLTQDPFVLPSPVAVADAFASELASGDMTAALYQSVRHWIPGTIAGTGLGVAAGVAFGWSRLLDDLTAPLVRTPPPVPPLAPIGFPMPWLRITHSAPPL